MKKTLFLLTALFCCTMSASAYITGTTDAGKGAAVQAIQNGKVVYETTVDYTNQYRLYTVGAVDVVISRPGAVDYTFLGVNDKGGHLTLPAARMAFGDVNGDNMVNIMDMAAFRKDFGKSADALSNPATDINGDGLVNIADMGFFRRDFGKTAADCTVDARSGPGTPVIFVESHEETLKGIEVTFLVNGEKELRLVSDDSHLIPGKLYWATVNPETELVTAVAIEADEPWVLSGTVTFADTDYLEIDGVGVELTEGCPIWAVSKSGDRLSPLDCADSDRQTVVLRRYVGGPGYMVFQYKGEILGW